MSRTLDAVTVLELSGESSTSDVREVVARDMQLSAIDAASLCGQPWSRVEAVSLSQNPLGRDAVLWEWLGHCSTSLRCLNLNFCELDSLEVCWRCIVCISG